MDQVDFQKFILGWEGKFGWAGGEGPLTNNSKVLPTKVHLKVCESKCVSVCVCETVGFSDQSPGSVGVHSLFGGESEHIQSKLL